MIDIVRSLRGILADISLQSRNLDGRGLTVGEATEVGWLLWRCSVQIKAAQEVCKQVLREHALTRSKGQPGPVDFFGSGQVSCRVTLQEPACQVREDVDIPALRAALPPEVYNECFEERTRLRLRPKLQELLASHLTDDQKKVVFAALDIDTPPPRVGFGESKR